MKPPQGVNHMPNILLTLPNITQSVVRPIVTDITTQVKHNLAITPEAETYFFSDDGHTTTAGSRIGQASTDVRFASSRMVMLEVEQSVNMDNLATSVSNREEHIPIFEDPRLGIIVRPVYESRDVRLNFKYRTTSKQEAQRWKDDISIKVNTMREMFLHNIRYHYGLPKQVWDLLSEVYDKRQAVAPYNQDFAEYIHECTRGRLTCIAEGTGQFRLPVVPELQGRIIGMCEFTPLPEKAEHEDELGTFLITFTYKFTYDCPIGCNMIYPIMVHNQYLDEEFINFAGPAPYRETVQKSFSESFHAFRHFETEPVMNDLKPIHPYLRIPLFDDFTPRSTATGTATIALALLQFQSESDKLLFNLEDLGQACIHPEIVKFIKEVESPWMNKLYRSIFHVSMYEGDRLCSPQSVLVDRSLDLFTTRPIDLRQCYHFRLAIVTDLSLLDKAALERLKKYPKVFLLYFEALNYMLKTRPDFQNLGNQRFITKGQLDFLWWIISGGGAGSVPDWVSRDYAPPSNALGYNNPGSGINKGGIGGSGVGPGSSNAVNDPGAYGNDGPVMHTGVFPSIPGGGGGSHGSVDGVGSGYGSSMTGVYGNYTSTGHSGTTGTGNLNTSGYGTGSTPGGSAVPGSGMGNTPNKNSYNYNQGSNNSNNSSIRHPYGPNGGGYRGSQSTSGSYSTNGSGLFDDPNWSIIANFSRKQGVMKTVQTSGILVYRN